MPADKKHQPEFACFAKVSNRHQELPPDSTLSTENRKPLFLGEKSVVAKVSSSRRNKQQGLTPVNRPRK